MAPSEAESLAEIWDMDSPMVCIADLKPPWKCHCLACGRAPLQTRIEALHLALMVMGQVGSGLSFWTTPLNSPGSHEDSIDPRSRWTSEQITGFTDQMTSDRRVARISAARQLDLPDTNDSIADLLLERSQRLDLDHAVWTVLGPESGSSLTATSPAPPFVPPSTRRDGTPWPGHRPYFQESTTGVEEIRCADCDFYCEVSPVRLWPDEQAKFFEIIAKEHIRDTSPPLTLCWPCRFQPLLGLRTSRAGTIYPMLSPRLGPWQGWPNLPSYESNTCWDEDAKQPGSCRLCGACLMEILTENPGWARVQFHRPLVSSEQWLKRQAISVQDLLDPDWSLEQVGISPADYKFQPDRPEDLCTDLLAVVNWMAAHPSGV